MKRFVLPVAALLGLAGCVQHNFVPGPGAANPNTQMVAGQCKLVAINGGNGGVNRVDPVAHALEILRYLVAGVVMVVRFAHNGHHLRRRADVRRRIVHARP